MPLVPYKWNDTHVDIILDKDDDETVREKNIIAFFKGIKVDNLGPKNISKIIKTGYDTVPKIIAMNKEDFLKVPGFKEKTATKLYNGIKFQTDEASLSELMVASNVFGRGYILSFTTITPSISYLYAFRQSSNSLDSSSFEISSFTSYANCLRRIRCGP